MKTKKHWSGLDTRSVNCLKKAGINTDDPNLGSSIQGDFERVAKKLWGVAGFGRQCLYSIAVFAGVSFIPESLKKRPHKPFTGAPSIVSISVVGYGPPERFAVGSEFDAVGQTFKVTSRREWRTGRFFAMATPTQEGKA